MGLLRRWATRPAPKRPLTDPLAHPCRWPWCKAPAGQVCVQKDGKTPYGRFHRDREAAAEAHQ